MSQIGVRRTGCRRAARSSKLSFQAGAEGAGMGWPAVASEIQQHVHMALGYWRKPAAARSSPCGIAGDSILKGRLPPAGGKFCPLD
jgi:hypothetical protein